MKKATKNLVAVSTVNRNSKFTMGNGAFSNDVYTTTATELYFALRRCIIAEFNSVSLRVSWGHHSDNAIYSVKKFTTPQSGNGISIGCMQFSQNGLHKIAKFVGFSQSALRDYFPKFHRLGADKPKSRTVKAKAERAGRSSSRTS